MKQSSSPPREAGAALQEYCVQRMNGEGTVTGSVERGGVYREFVTPVTKQ
jgi:hypothetical protein